MLEVKQYNSAAEMREAYRRRLTPKSPVVIKPAEVVDDSCFLETELTTPQAILRTVCSEAGISSDDLRNEDRAKNLVIARAVFFHCCKAFTFRTVSEAARVLNRHHTTALHLLEKVERSHFKYEPLLSTVKKRICQEIASA